MYEPLLEAPSPLSTMKVIISDFRVRMNDDVIEYYIV